MMRVDSIEEQWAKIHFKAITDKKLNYKARKVYDHPKGNPIWVTLIKDVEIQNKWIITDDVVDIYQNDTFKITSHLDHPKYKYSFNIGFRFPEPLLKAEKGKVTAYICGILFEGKDSIEIRKDKLIYVDGVDKTPAHLRVDPSKALMPPSAEVAKPAASSTQTDKEEKTSPALRQSPTAVAAGPNIMAAKAHDNSSVTQILRAMPKLSLTSSPKSPPTETQAQPKSSSQNEVDTGKWLAEMRAKIAGRANVADVCVETDSGQHVGMSNEKPITGDDIRKVQTQFR